MKCSKKRSDESYFVRKTFTRFFFPSLFSMLGMSLCDLAGCLFVGNRVGTAGLAAISFGSPVYLFYSLVVDGTAVGGSIHYASAMSRGNVEEGNSIFNRVLRFVIAFNLLTAVLGVFFLPQILRLLGAEAGDTATEAYVCAQFLFAPIMFCQAPFYYFVYNDGAPKLAAAGMVTANVVDISLNALFVIGMNMGVVGSVYSAAIGALCNIFICTAYILRRKGSLRFRLHPRKLDAVLPAIRTGVASSGNNLYSFIMLLVLNRLLMEHAGIQGVAIFDVVYNVLSLTKGLTDSVGLTLQPMVSTYLGEQDMASIRASLHRAMYQSLLLCCGAALILAVSAPWYCPLFGLSEAETLTGGVIAIRIACLSIPFSACNGTMIYFYQSVEREKWAYLLDLLRSFVLALLGIVLLLPLPLERFWFFYLFSEGGTFLVLCVLNQYRNVLRQLSESFRDHVQPAVVRCVEDIVPASRQMEIFLERFGSSSVQAMAVSLVMEELSSIIIQYANGEDVCIQATLVREKGGFTLHIRDDLLRFNPFERDAETGDLLLADEESLQLLGMKIVREKSRGVFYRRYAGFNTLTIQL